MDILSPPARPSQFNRAGLSSARPAASAALAGVTWTYTDVGSATYTGRVDRCDGTAWVMIVPPTGTSAPQVPNTIATLGDSILARNMGLEGFLANPSSNTFFFSGTRNILALAMTIMGWPLRLIATGGVQGETTAQILTRAPAVLAFKPGYLLYDGGPNDLSADIDSTTILANIKAVWALCEAQGTICMPMTIVPTTIANTTARKNTVYVVNNTLRQWSRYPSAAGMHGSIILVDAAKAYADPSTGDPVAGYTLDGTHPNPTGAVLLAYKLVAALRNAGLRSQSLLPYTNADVISAGATLGSWLANPMLAGGATVATSWTSAANSGSPTLTSSKVARGSRPGDTDIWGYPTYLPGEAWQRQQVTGAGDVKLSLAADVTITAGTRVYAGIHYSLGAVPTALSNLELTLSAQTAGGGSTLQFAVGNYTDPTDTLPTSFPTSGVILTPSFAVPNTTGRLSVKARANGTDLDVAWARAFVLTDTIGQS